MRDDFWEEQKESYVQDSFIDNEVYEISLNTCSNYVLKLSSIAVI